MSRVPKTELVSRLERFAALMDKTFTDWELCAITGGINMFYLTGTICDGVLMIRRDTEAVLWVRRSYDRALLESEFGDIRPMRSFRDIADAQSSLPDTLYIDASNATLEWYGLLSKYMSFAKTLPMDNVILNTRAVKNKYEIDIMRRAGSQTDRIFNEELPALLYDGISEVELGADLFPVLLKSGFHGVTRFSMRNVDAILGHVLFGDSSLYPSTFNGAAGVDGLCPAVPLLGNRNRFLRKGDLIYFDFGVGIDGYHIDKTLVLSYALAQPDYVSAAHQHCLELEKLAASMLKPGAIPSDIYTTLTESVKVEYRQYFMGAKGRTVPFIGHGVGLNVNEMPVIAKGFDSPLEENMAIAVEPKISIDGIGMVGSENTYLVTKNGGISLTGEPRNLDVICGCTG